MSAERSGGGDERWSQWLQELNSYLADTQQEYQIMVRLYLISGYDEEVREKAQVKCFA